MLDPYEALALAYDELMYDVPYAEWNAYIERLLEGAGCPKGGNVLEYACGTGTITRGLLEAGYSVIALDRSEQMLDMAAQKMRKLPRKPQLVCADMGEFRLGKPADAAVCACDGVNYLLSEAELGRFLEGVYANLKPGGVLLFDVSSHSKLANVLGNEFFYDDGDERTLFWQNSYDEESECVTMEITLFLREGEGYTRYDEAHVQRAWRVDEIESALQGAGFSELNVYGVGTESRPGENEQRIQFCAKRME